MPAITPEQIASILEIHSLKARYFRFIDTKQWQALKTLFTPDATIFYPESQSEPAALEPAIELISKALATGISIHHGHMPEIEILTPTTAHGIWAMEDKIYFPTNAENFLGLESLHGFGHYHEDYVRLDEGWRIKTLKLTRLWSRQITPARAFS